MRQELYAALGRTPSIEDQDKSANESTSPTKEANWPENIPTPEYLFAFEKGAGKKLEDLGSKDNTKILFTLRGKKQMRSPNAVFLSVAQRVLDSREVGKAKQLCIHIRDGKAPEEAIRLIEITQEVGEINQEYLLAFERGAGKQLENIYLEDRNRIDFKIGTVNLARSPNALFISVAYHVFKSGEIGKAKQYCIHIRDSRSPEEAKTLVETLHKNSAINQEYLLAFEKAVGKRFEEMSYEDLNRVSFKVGTVILERSPNSLLGWVSRNFFGGKAARKARQYCAHIRDGKTPNEAKKLAETEEIRPLNSPHEINIEYLQAFEKGAGKRLEEISTKDENHVVYKVGKINLERSPISLFRGVARNIFGTSETGKGKQCCIYIRDGKTAEEAKRLVEAAGEADVTSQEYLLAFEKGAGKKLNEMPGKDTSRIQFIINEAKYSTSPNALFNKVARIVFGTSEIGKAQQYCIHIRDGKTSEEAINLIEIATETGEINQEYLLAFEKGAGRRLEEMRFKDSNRIPFIIRSQKFERSPEALFKFVANKILNTDEMSKGKQICIYIRDGKTVQEAKEIIELIDQASKLDTKYLLAFEKAAGDKFENMDATDSNNVSFTVGSVKMKRSPSSLFQFIGKKILNTQKTSNIRNFCIFVRNGKTIEEAVQLVGYGEDAIEDDGFEQLSSLRLEEAISFLQEDPLKLKLYLQYAHPEFSEKEINNLIIRSFKGLVTTANEQKEDEYLSWDVQLADVFVETEVPHQTQEPTLVLTGTAVGASHFYLAGSWNRRVKTEADGSFSVTIPLRIGELNEIRIMALDRDQELRSEQISFAVLQTGEPDDTEALISLLSGLHKNLLEGIRKDPERLKFFIACAEKVLIKKFGRSFEDGKEYIEGLIASSPSPVVQKVLKGVLKNFEAINRMRLSNVQDGSLMFFQKYCVYAIRKKMAEGAWGVVLANDPGLGKTRTILAALAQEEAAIFTPNSVVSAWDEESGEVLKDPSLLVMRDIPHATRKQLLKNGEHLRLVTNVQFLQNTRDAERFALLSNENTVVVHDEAHSRSNEKSEQSKGAKMLRHRFQINVSATPFKNPETLRRILALLEPDDPRFRSKAAFAAAFPAGDPQALKALSLLKEQYTIRFRKQDVMETVDPKILLSQQPHRLPMKEYIPSETLGQFEIGDAQAEAIYELFLNWPQWCRRYDKYIPKDEIAKEDGLRTTEGLTKRHALRQIVNNPSYIGAHEEDAKAWQVQRIVRKCLKEGRKVVIFCKYNAQALKYAEMFKKHHPALYTGTTSNEGWKKDEHGNPLSFARETIGHNKHGWVFDEHGYPKADPVGEQMSSLDYERLTFQHADDRKIIIATYKAGSVGTTFTAGKAMILDDVPEDVTELIQAEDRIHRIDPHHQTHASVRYYNMRSKYSDRFLQKMKKRWVVKQWDGTYAEYRSKAAALREAGEGAQVETAYDAFFAQGTFDEVNSSNLKVQKQMFHLINDGIADDAILKEGQIAFKPFVGEKE